MMTFLSDINTSYVPYIIVAVLVSFIVYIAHKAKSSNFSIFDLVMDPSTGKASVTKLWQNVAAGTASVAIIQQSANHTLTDTMLAVYLGALGVSEAWSRFVGAKYSGNTTNQ
ncbi:hypothetical protein [Ralstonia phage RP13]|nr:hypothetical protein [Ralstonia phage RP13]